MKENFKFAQETGYYLPFMCVCWGGGGGIQCYINVGINP